MVRYFQRLPAAALRREIDGNLYAYTNVTVGANGVCECEPRMVRADDAEVKNGVVHVYIGSMGDAIAQTLNLPFSVDYAKA